MSKAPEGGRRSNRLSTGNSQHLVAVVLAGSAMLALTSCSDNRQVAPTDGSRGTLSGSLGPGAPPEGDVPARIELVFTQADKEARVTAVDGSYEIDLPVGTWNVTSEDGKACALGIQVVGASRQGHDLVYPGECSMVSLPSGPAPPAAPPSG